MKINGRILIFGYVLTLISLCVYSYALVDPNITLFNSNIWTFFRNNMVLLGYHNRPLSTALYVVLIALLFIFHGIYTKKANVVNPVTIGLIISLVVLVSYPFLSHDFFNYMFDARIFTHYGENPYLFRAIDFPQDDWLRFMHWTHRTYPYGPSFLALSLLPSLLSLGKFFLNFIFFKIFFVGFYLISIYVLNTMKREYAIVFATHPLIIIEGLVNAHNDFIAVGCALLGLYYVQSRHNIIGRFLMLISGGIKYITLPFLIVSGKDNKKTSQRMMSSMSVNYASLLMISAIILYISLFQGTQPWYFLNFFVFLPLYPRIIHDFRFFSVGLLLSYYPYIMLGGWDSLEKVSIKNSIITVFFALNIMYVVLRKLLFRELPHR